MATPEHAACLVSVHVGVGVQAGDHHHGGLPVPRQGLVGQAPLRANVQLMHRQSAHSDAPHLVTTGQPPGSQSTR